ncbi:MAG: hypothetical protein WCK98_07205 [bacterium]
MECAKDTEVVSILVYGKSSDYETIKTFKCSNQGLIQIKNSGIVASGVSKENVYGKMELQEQLNIGYYNLNADFIRENTIDESFSYLVWKNNQQQYGSFKANGFTQAYQDSKTLRLLFNDKQEPVDDYLKSCKNEQGKTIFNVFKEN